MEEIQRLEVRVMSASNLKPVRDVLKMHPYVSVSLSGDEQLTPVDEDGHTNPNWGHLLAFTVNMVAALTENLTLEFKIMTRRTIKRNKEVGKVKVSVKELVDQQDCGKPKLMRCSVSLPPKKTQQTQQIQGILEFSYKFGEYNAASDAPPAGNEHTPQVYGYPPNATPVYGHPAPSAAYQEPPRKSGGLADGLRLMALGDVLSDASEGAANAVGGVADMLEM